MAKADGLQRFGDKLRRDPTAWRDRNMIIVAFGDSVTQGLTVTPRMIGEEVFHAVLRRELTHRFAERTFTTVNAGVGGDTAVGALERVQADVIDHHPDLVTICFGLNDSCDGEVGLDPFEHSLNEIVVRLRKEGVGVILLTPNMMPTRPSSQVDPNYRHSLEPYIERGTSGLFDRYVERIRRVAGRTATPLADAYAEWKRREENGEDMTQHLVNGLDHPDAEGHRIFAYLLLEIILASTT